MKISEMRTQSKEELMRALKETSEKVRSLKFDLVQGKIKNIHAFRAARRDVARILTLLKEKK